MPETRDLVLESGIEFRDLGARALKGVPGEWRVFAVDCSEGAPSAPMA